jgi:hypothetical protein
VRRSSQAERAYSADLIVEAPAGQTGHVIERLWLEVQDARNPTPEVKLKQAERDCASREQTRHRWPVVIWHRTGARLMHATMRLGTLLDVLGVTGPRPSVTVTMTLDEFLVLL